MATEHEHWQAQSEVYAVGALDSAELNEFEAHLGAGCAVCQAYVRETAEALLLLHRTLAPITPSVSVKNRIFDDISSKEVAPRIAHPIPKGRSWQVMTGTVAAGIIGILIGGSYYHYRYEPRHTLYSSVIELLRDPTTRDHPLNGAGPTPNAKGRFLWNESGEGHIFVSGLPAAAQGQMYAVWTIAQQSAPRYVGSIQTDADGKGGLHIKAARPDRPVETFAVTIEPLGNTAAPSGPVVLVSKAS